MLTPSRVIEIQPWMTAPEIQTLFSALQDDRAEPQILFVGGCVRNTLLQKPPGDFDLATVHVPDEVVRRLTSRGIKVVPTGIEHGTVTAIISGKPFEITTLRRDIETDGRHAVVSFTQSWEEDAQRRDFTMNTLLVDYQGNIFDPIRSGIVDLASGRVVFVGEPEQRIAEDILRILRFFRFYGAFGAGAPDARALAACAQFAPKIITLSRERITQETMKILGFDRAADVLDLMFQNKVMADLPHSSYSPDMLRHFCGIQKRFGSINLEARIVILCAGNIDHLRIVEKYLLFSNAQRKMLESLFKSIQDPARIRERLYRYGREIGAQSALIRAVIDDVIIPESDMEVIRHWEIPVLPLNGEDLKNLGITPGPQMGEVMREVETWWIEWDFQPDRTQCLERAAIIKAQ